MGGLGNLLFQVSLALVIGRRNNNKVEYYKYINSYIDKRKNITEYSIFRNLEIINKDVKSDNFMIIRENSFEYDEKISNIKLDNRYQYLLFGYFQSYKYIIEDREYIINKLENKYEKEIEEKMNKIKEKYNNKKIVSIHVRRGDYLNLPDYHYNLSDKYYNNAIKKYDIENTVFIIFSDDVEYIKNDFIKNVNIKYKEIIEDNNEERSLWIMSSCKDGHILANSSFSWWGDYLNMNKEKIVCCPVRWFGDKGMKYKIFDIFPILESGKYGKYYLVDDK